MASRYKIHSWSQGKFVPVAIVSALMKIPFKFDSLSSSSHCRPFVSISHLSFSFNNNDSSNEFFYFSKIWSFFDLSLLSFFERKILLWKTRIHDSLSSLLFTFFVCLRTNCCPRFKKKKNDPFRISRRVTHGSPFIVHETTRAILPHTGKNKVSSFV